MKSPADNDSGATEQSQLTERLVRNTTVSFNLGIRILSIVEDKVKLAVHTHLAKVEQRRGWWAPAGIFATVLLATITADFKKTVLSAALWEAMFLLATIGTGVWLVRSLFRASKAPSVDDFVDLLREAQVPPQAGPAATVPDLRTTLISRTWRLRFRPGRYKTITFLENGQVGEGQNQNEHTWRLSADELELLKDDGSVHSRFVFDARDHRWQHTNDADIPSRDQYILLP